MGQPQIIRIAPKGTDSKPAQPGPAADPLELPPSPAGTDNRSNTNGREWWAQRWIDVLESFGWRRRLERARNYVREGRVLKLEFKGAKVVAKVQGTAPDPYDVKLSLDPFTDEQWHYAIEEMSRRAIFAAKLLAGEMPQNIEEAFIASGLSLFPFSKFDIHSRCSCPDPVNPCKHIGAVYYLLGDHFSQDPFILFQLRGKTKQEIITTLRQLRTTPGGNSVPEMSFATAQVTPLEVGAAFWDYNAQLDPSLVVIAPPPGNETVLDLLGAIPLEASYGGMGKPNPPQQLLMEGLFKIYQQVSQDALLSAMTAPDQSSMVR